MFAWECECPWEWTAGESGTRRVGGRAEVADGSWGEPTAGPIEVTKGDPMEVAEVAEATEVVRLLASVEPLVAVVLSEEGAVVAGGIDAGALGEVLASAPEPTGEWVDATAGAGITGNEVAGTAVLGVVFISALGPTYIALAA